MCSTCIPKRAQLANHRQLPQFRNAHLTDYDICTTVLFTCSLPMFTGVFQFTLHRLLSVVLLEMLIEWTRVTIGTISNDLNH